MTQNTCQNRMIWYRFGIAIWSRQPDAYKAVGIDSVKSPCSWSTLNALYLPCNNLDCFSTMIVVDAHISSKPPLENYFVRIKNSNQIVHNHNLITKSNRICSRFQSLIAKTCWLSRFVFFFNFIHPISAKCKWPCLSCALWYFLE